MTQQQEEATQEDVRLLTAEQVVETKAEWEEWRYNDERMVPEVLIEAMDPLILAAELVTEMATALERFADRAAWDFGDTGDTPMWLVGELSDKDDDDPAADPRAFAVAALARYRAAFPKEVARG